MKLLSGRMDMLIILLLMFLILIIRLNCLKMQGIKFWNLNRCFFNFGRMVASFLILRDLMVSDWSLTRFFNHRGETRGKEEKHREVLCVSFSVNSVSKKN